MRHKITQVSILAAMAMAVLSLAAPPSFAVVAISSEAYVYVSGEPIRSLWEPRYSLFKRSIDLSSFQSSLEGSAEKNGATSHASASLDYTLAIDEPSGTIQGHFVGQAWGEITSLLDKPANYRAGTTANLVFSVPEGEYANYRLIGGVQKYPTNSYIFGLVTINNWRPDHMEPGNITYAVAAEPSFALEGTLLPGIYVLSVTAKTGIERICPQGQLNRVSTDLSFTIVPEPTSMLLMLLLPLARGSIKTCVN